MVKRSTRDFVATDSVRGRQHESKMEPPMKKARVHFGSLEEQEKKKLSDAGKGLSSSVSAGIKAGNINIDTGQCALFRVIEFGFSFLSHVILNNF